MGKKAAFWATVAGVAIVANFALEYAAAKVPSLGLARFVSFTHKGAAE